jgi:hypothetical protein
MGAATASVRAHIGYIPHGTTPAGRRARQQYHVILDQAATIGGDGQPRLIGRYAGEPLCGTTGEVLDPPIGLFPAEVSCVSCSAIAVRQQIKVRRGELGVGKTALLVHLPGQRGGDR